MAELVDAKGVCYMLPMMLSDPNRLFYVALEG